MAVAGLAALSVGSVGSVAALAAPTRSGTNLLGVFAGAHSLTLAPARKTSSGGGTTTTTSTTTSTTTTSTTSTTAPATTPVSVRVSGNQLVNGGGAPIRLLGVDRSGTEYACAQGWGIFDGPSDQASVDAIKSWHVDAVRVPLNEDCWLGINGVPSAYSGANYRAAIQSYVSELHADGMVAVLDLHWNAPGGQLALGQQVMADADHSPAFWTSVATTFKSDPGVVFDLYNEPHDISWSCWLNGCVTSAGWQAAGMQQLLDAVRSTGATQPVLAGGNNWSGDLSQWLANEPSDPAHQLAASAHIYNFSGCNTSTCWDQTIAPVAVQVPVVTGEIGENDCAASFVDSYMAWADSHAVSYLAWAWNTAGCSSFPALISSYTGTPTAFGAGVQTHLATEATVVTPAVGGYAMDSYGDLLPFSSGAGAPAVANLTASWPGQSIARDVIGVPARTGGYTLDGYGLLHPFAVGTDPLPPAATVSDSWPGWDIARAAALLPSGTGGYVLDGWGGIHPFAVGTNPMPAAVTASAYFNQQDIARDLFVLPGGTGGYVLDGYGQLHPFAIGSNPMPPAVTLSDSWPGWDIARGVVGLSTGTGGYVLDGWGGVHPFAVGSNPMPAAVTTSSYWAYQDTARRLVLDGTGTGGWVVNTAGQVAPFAVGSAAMPYAPGSVTLATGSQGRGVVLFG